MVSFIKKARFRRRTFHEQNLIEGGELAYGSADFENNFAQISDSKQDFNGFPDPATAAECGFIYFLGPDLDYASNTSIFARISDSGRKFNGGFG